MFDFSPAGIRRAMQHQSQVEARWLLLHRSGRLVSSLWAIATENPTFVQFVLEELERQRGVVHDNNPEEIT